MAKPIFNPLTGKFDMITSSQAEIPDIATTYLKLDASNDPLIGDLVSNNDIKALSFTIGSNTLTTSEWAYLDGQDQTVKTTSSPVFLRQALGAGSIIDNTILLNVYDTSTTGSLTGISSALIAIGYAATGLNIIVDSDTSSTGVAGYAAFEGTNAGSTAQGLSFGTYSGGTVGSNTSILYGMFLWGTGTAQTASITSNKVFGAYIIPWYKFGAHPGNLRALIANDVVGLYLENAYEKGTGGSWAREYGAYIELPDQGTANYQLALGGTAGGSGIWFNAPAIGSAITNYSRVYASAASTLDLDINGTTKLKTDATSITATNDVTIGTTTAGNNLTVNSTLGNELCPVLTTGNWTMGTAWRYLTTPNRIDKYAAGGVANTATPTASMGISIGTTYKVVITVDVCSTLGARYTLGGVMGSAIAISASPVTYTDYITASTTANLIFVPSATNNRMTISAVSVKALSNGTTTIDGRLAWNSPISANVNFKGNVGVGTSQATSLFSVGEKTIDGTAAGYSNYFNVDALGNTVIGNNNVLSPAGVAGAQLIFGNWYAGNLPAPAFIYNGPSQYMALGQAHDGSVDPASDILRLGTISNIGGLWDAWSSIYSYTFALEIDGGLTVGYDVNPGSNIGYGNLLVFRKLGVGLTSMTANLQIAQSTTGPGKISASASGTTVTGNASTEFLNTFKVGDTITSEGQTHTISAIASNTSMTTDAWSPAVTNKVYTLVGGTRFSVLGNGNVGIGTTAPSALLHLAAGTATAGTAPFKLTSGTNMTTAETGAVEYDGTNLNFTPTGTLREFIHFGSKGSATLTAGTTTTITTAGAKTTSVILIQPTSAAATVLGIYVSAKNAGNFVLIHTLAAGTETVDWVLVN